MWSQEVIAAISTPPGEGGIAIVRLSGEEAWDVAGRVFRSRKPVFTPRPWRVFLGYILNSKGDRIDECLCTYFKGPKSFTGEDVVEFNVHGGSFVAGRVLESLLAHGARLAAPGEFTKRAFLNGRLDISQAEAVIDIIRSNSDVALRNAGHHLQGQLSGEIADARRLLLSIMAQIEVSIDFPEHDIPTVTYVEIAHTLEKAAGTVAAL
ncbi:MAG: tRNA uridine-5-carboxymethylaminomethyl(34) synthesis GTPase MnmE, partial [Bacillota bacterium]|nr:tRNA uridine-5-carboxymethylaminomethyl(34) synthesis GTPase MnmE [Bacillota bacterium]